MGSQRSRAPPRKALGATLLLFILLAGGWTSTILVGNELVPSNESAAESSSGLSGHTSALAEGSVARESPMDFGIAYGLRPGELVIDPERFGLVRATHAYLDAYGPSDPTSAPKATTLSFETILSEPRLGIDDEARKWMALRDPVTPENPADYPVALALDRYVRLLDLEEELFDRISDYNPGGIEGYTSALTSLTGTQPGEPDVQAELDRVLPKEFADRLATAVLEFNHVQEAAQRALKTPLRSQSSTSTSLAGADLREFIETQYALGNFEGPAIALQAIGRALGYPSTNPIPHSKDVLAAIRAYADAIGHPLTEANEAQISSYAGNLSASDAIVVASLLSALAQAESMARSALSSVPPETLGRIQELYGKEGDGLGLSASEATELVDLLGTFDSKALWEAFVLSAEVGQSVADRYVSAPAQSAQAGGAPMLFVPSREDPFLIIGTARSETYDVDAPIVIDFGGDDVYTVPVGGGLGGEPDVPPKVAGTLEDQSLVHFLLDLGGDDTYRPVLTSASGETALGAGTGGRIGLAFDWAGNDTVDLVPVPPASVGAGWAGFGAYWDNSGNDTYRYQALGQSSRRAFGAGGERGLGLFGDRTGDDMFALDLGSPPGPGNLLGGAAQRQSNGIFLDLRGDDTYSVAGQPTSVGSKHPQHLALGAVGLTENKGGQGTSTAAFLDAGGNDQYSIAGPNGMGWAGVDGAALFLDLEGVDSYANTLAYTDGKPGDDQTWRKIGTVQGIGVGVDRATARPLHADAEVTFLSPAPRAVAALGARLPFPVRVMNLGSVPVENANVAFRVISREDDAQPGQTLHEEIVSFGHLLPGESRTQSLVITAPLTERRLYAIAELAAVPDADPANDRDTVDWDARDVNDVRVLNVRVTESGRVGPDEIVQVRAQLYNFGNTGPTVPVSLSTSPPTVAPPDATFDLARPDVFYTSTLMPTVLDIAIPWKAPTQLGPYRLDITVPEAFNDVCGNCRSSFIDIRVEPFVDGLLSIENPTPITDPSSFDGVWFRVHNAGTVTIDATVALHTILPGGQVDHAENIVRLAPDESRRVRSPMPPQKPLPGQVWTFIASLDMQGEEQPQAGNNDVTFQVRFAPDVIAGDDMEQPNPSVRLDGAWQRGMPANARGIAPISGTNALATDLDGDGNRVLPGTVHEATIAIDLQKVLDPRLVIWSAHDAYGASSGTGQNGGYVAVSVAGEAAFQRLIPRGGYPCLNLRAGDELSGEGGPAFCGWQPWSSWEFDLSEYQGKRVDLRFRYAASCCFHAGYAGWLIDDVILMGTRREAGDFQVLKVQATPEPLLANEPAQVEVVIRNNGFEAGDAAGSLSVFLGTKDRRAVFPFNVTGLGPAATTTQRFAWTPTSASKHLLHAEVEAANDSRRANDQRDSVADVYLPLAKDDLEYVPPCAAAQPCQNWTHRGRLPSHDEWEHGAPIDYPGHAASGQAAWATDLDDAYTLGTHREMILSSPDWTVPAAGFLNGDQHSLFIEHAYEMTGGPSCKPHSDLAYVTVERNGGQPSLLSPETPYPILGAGGAPSSNPRGLGFTGKSSGFRIDSFPVAQAQPGDTLRFNFHLYVNSQSTNCTASARAGWTIDDPRLVAHPRFEDDLAIQSLSPSVLSLGKTNTISVAVQNFGRHVAANASIRLTLQVPGNPINVTQPLPPIGPGQLGRLDFVVDIPVTTGSVPAQAQIVWDADQWAPNDEVQTMVRLARIIYESNFEIDGGGFTSSGNTPFALGAPVGRPPLEGASSWSTGSLNLARSSFLTGPKILLRDPTGLRLPKTFFEGLVLFDGHDEALLCPANGFRLVDVATDSDRPIVLSPSSLVDVPSFGALAQCGNYKPLAFRADLSSRAVAYPALQPEFQVRTANGFLAVRTPNEGAEVDDLVVYGLPFGRNLRVSNAPGALHLGPGEQARVTVMVTNEGLKLPPGRLAVEFSSNDQALGGKPSLKSQVLLPSEWSFAESVPVTTVWDVPPSLSNRVVTVRARIVALQDGRWAPLFDDEASDNAVFRRFSVLELHDLAVSVEAQPSLSPHAVAATAIKTTIVNRGTLTERDVELSLRILDRAGQVVTEFPATTRFDVAPDFAEPAIIVEHSFDPPAPGHYSVEARVSYPSSTGDLHPADNLARNELHAGVMPDRFGTSFDGKEDEDWTALGGIASAMGFETFHLKPGAPEGEWVVATNVGHPQYEALALYRLDIPLQIDGPSVRLSAKHWYDLGPDDVARVLSSSDGGATWRPLTPLGGFGGPLDGFSGQSDGWRAIEFDLSTLPAGDARIRFEMNADARDQGAGWRIDDILLTSKGTVLHREGFEDPLGPTTDRWDFEAGDQGWTHSATLLTLDDWRHGVPAYHLKGGHASEKAWGTRLDGPYSVSEAGTRYLRSPPIPVPAAPRSVTLSWWQWYEIQYETCTRGSGPGQCSAPTPADAALVRLQVEEGPTVVVTPTKGYPKPVPLETGSRDGYMDTSGGWERQTLDLTPYKGKTVIVEFLLAVTSTQRQALGPAGAAGYYVDDVSIHVEPFQPALAENLRIGGVSAPHVVAGEPASFDVEVVNEAGGERSAEFAWSWIGPSGTPLASQKSDVNLPPGRTVLSRVLPALDTPQAGVLKLALTGPTDERLDDSLITVPAPVHALLHRSTFEVPGDESGCGATTPCWGWTHGGGFELSDEWHHGRIPAAKHPGRAASGDFAYSTDLLHDRRYQDSSRTGLRSPMIEVPDEGAIVRFKHALDAGAPDGPTADGGTLRVWAGLSRQVLRPDAPYTRENCGPAAQNMPCFAGRFDWRTETASLDAYANQRIQIEFLFQSDSSTNAAGWSLDDVEILGRPPRPAKDVGLIVPRELALDARYPQSIHVVAKGFGRELSDPVLLRVERFRAGVISEVVHHRIPPLFLGEEWNVAIDVPPGAASDSLLRYSLVRTPEHSDDENPANDHATTQVRSVTTLYREDFESNPVIVQSSGAKGRFMVSSPPAGVPNAPSANVLVAGFARGPLAPYHSFELPALTVPPGALLEFDHYYSFGGPSDGAVVEYSRDAGNSWFLVEPEDGYPRERYCKGRHPSPPVHRCFTSSAAWAHASFPLENLEGDRVRLRLRYGGTEKGEFGWAIDNIRLVATTVAEASIDSPRWGRGPVENPNGPLEPVSLPNAWGTGLRGDSARDDGWDVLESPPIAMSRIVDPFLGFDFWGHPETDGRLSVQTLDRAGNWLELRQLNDTGGLWRRIELPLHDLGSMTKVRFVYTTPTVASPSPRPGVFIDNVLLGSLHASIEPATTVDLRGTDGSAFFVPLRVTNDGAFTNQYGFSVRGPNPFWAGQSSPSTITLNPGESAVVNVTVEVPPGGRAGPNPFAIVAESLYDPLQASALELQAMISVRPRPDWFIDGQAGRSGFVFQNVFDVNGTPTVVEARSNSLGVYVRNKGADSDEDPFVQFFEVLNTTEIRAVDRQPLPRPNATSDVVLVLTRHWLPRRDVVAIGAEINPGEQIIELSRTDNRVVLPIHVEPRPLPELVLAAEPRVARLPSVDQPTSVGLDIQNVGAIATSHAVDVAVLAGYQDAFLTSPQVDLPPNAEFRVSYASDLEPRRDGVRVEAAGEDGVWKELVPVGGYPHGCISAFDCQDGVTGHSETAQLVFRLRPLHGPTQFRLRFGMDPNNGNLYDGFVVPSIRIDHGATRFAIFDFTRGAGGWTSTHTWAYRAPEGPIPGAWAIPQNYENPFLVDLRPVPNGACPCSLAVGQLAHVDMSWTPREAGDQPLLVVLDPADLEPEYVDDQNRFPANIHVFSSGFGARISGSAEFHNATSQRDLDLVLENRGDHRARFQLRLRPHNLFSLELLAERRPLGDVELEPGQTLRAQLRVGALGAPAGAHTLYLEAFDPLTAQSFTIGLPVRVGLAGGLPRVVGDMDLHVRQKDSGTLIVQNPSNDLVPIILRIAHKPQGLAVRIQPDEFKLAPFESRTVEVEMLNLGVAADTYQLGLVNAAISCPPDQVACNQIATLAVVVEAYAAPRALLEMPSTADLGVPVAFRDASVSNGSRIDSWHWRFGDGVESHVQHPTHTFTKPGVYDVRLRVTDAEGGVAEATPGTLIVGNRDPVALARFANVPDGKARVGQQVNFSAADSTDHDGGIVEVSWSFGDGNFAQGQDVSHVYQAEGVYRVTVVVRDGFGAANLNLLTIEVLPGEERMEPKDGAGGGRTPGPGAWSVLAAIGIATIVGARVGRRKGPAA